MIYNGNNLEQVLDAHERWINDDNNVNINYHDGIGPACIICGRLSDVDLSAKNLRYMLFINVVLENVIFDGSTLDHTKFINCHLYDCSFVNTGMREITFMSNYVCRCNFSNSVINGPGTDFSCSNMRHCDFTGIKCENYGYFRNTTFEKSCIGVLENLKIPMTCPTHGAFIGWKQAAIYELKYDQNGEEYLIKPYDNNEIIVKLLIPEDAKRSSSTGRKCRCNKAKVLAFEDLNGNSVSPAINQRVVSIYDSNFRYVVGETVSPDYDFCEDRLRECGSGIHFFVDKNEAIDY